VCWEMRAAGCGEGRSRVPAAWAVLAGYESGLSVDSSGKSSLRSCESCLVRRRWRSSLAVVRTAASSGAGGVAIWGGGAGSEGAGSGAVGDVRGLSPTEAAAMCIWRRGLGEGEKRGVLRRLRGCEEGVESLGVECLSAWAGVCSRCLGCWRCSEADVCS